MPRDLVGLIMLIALVAGICILLTLLSIILAWANEFRKGK